MAATSSDRAVRTFGRNWKRLHTFGIYHVWVIFLLIYLSSAMRPDTHRSIFFVIAGVFVVALGVRIASARKSRVSTETLVSISQYKR
ncbi:MAG: hypothetical protein ACREQH_09760, partial [Candidatus Binatus sp.]